DLLYEHLLAARDGLETAVDVDGPAERTSIMFKTFASNQWVIVLTALAVAATVGILFWIVTIWPGAIPQTPAGGEQRAPNEEMVLLTIVLMGSLGGLLRLTSSFTKFVGNRQLYRSWIVYYLLMPFEGAALAP